MKIYINRKAILLLAVLLSLSIAQGAAGPVLAPGHKLYVIKTEHFDIIFPEASRSSALRLSTMADAVYDEVTGKLDTKGPARMPVVITPDIGSFNGYTAQFPYNHIVLYDTSLDLGWTAFKDSFRGLFLHELTHAVSMGIKPAWADFLSGIFGSWVLPGFLNAPAFMVEGVTVSFESADGITGRANDPLVRARVRQDILENRFKTPMDASTLYDEYPGGSIFYEYGGLFNAYIQKTYGADKYAELWKAMGTVVFSLSLDPYEQLFYKAFHRVYGLPFLKAWAGFRNSLELQGVAEGPAPLWPTGRETRALMSGGLASDGSALYWVDARSKKAMAMDGETRKARALFDADAGTAITDAQGFAPAGARLLVTRAIGLPDGRDRIESIVYDLGSKRFLPETSVAGMREARFFRDGCVGIVSNLHNTDLVFASASGSKILLAGTDSLMFAQPAVLDRDRVALIVSAEGVRSIGILAVDSGKLELVRPEGPMPSDAKALDYVRQLSAFGGKLYFNYDSDDRLYKLGVLEPPADPGAGAGELRLDRTDFSGGVLWPVIAGGRVFHVGRFSQGDRICAYADRGALSDAIEYRLEDFDPADARAESEEVAAQAAASAKIEPYRPLAYANPFSMWFAYPDPIAYDRTFRPTAAFVFQDPMDANAVSLIAGYDTSYPFADLSLTWANAELPLPIVAKAADHLVYAMTGAPERQTTGSLETTLTLPLYPSSSALVFGLGGTILGRADGEDPEAINVSPYAWDYLGWDGTASAVAGWKGRIAGVAKSASRGFDFLTYHDFAFGSLSYKAEAHLVASYDRVPLRLDVWGAWANAPILDLASSSEVFASDRRPAYAEFATLSEKDPLYGIRSDFLVEGSLAYRLADQAMHANLLGLYFDRVLVDVGYRGAYFSDTVLSSSFLRLSVDAGAALGRVAGVFRFFCESYVRLSAVMDAMKSEEAMKALTAADIYGLRFGIQYDMDAGTFSSLEGAD
jgi:hypothetical protein